MSLRGTVSWAAALQLLLALGAAAGLAKVSSVQNEGAQQLGTAFEKVRLSGEVRVDLLRGQAAVTEAERAAINERLQGELEQLSDLVATAEGEALATEAQRAVARYLRGEATAPKGVGGSGADALGEALSALEALVALGERQIAAGLETSARLDRLSDLIAALIAVALLVGTAALLLWLWFSAFNPLFAVSGAMARFARGDRSVRAPERGLSELQAMARAFNSMATSLAEQRQRQLTFVAGVAHDLRNPISAVKAAAAALSRGAAPTKENVDRKAQLIGRQVDRLDRLVGDFLDRARVEAGRLELRREVCDLRETARASAELFETLSAAHPIGLRLGDEPLPVDCDRGRVEQILNNLLSNAIKYSPEGGAVEVRAGRDGAEATLSVSDRGIGMTEEDRAALFQPYRRVGTHRDAISGVGLGLYVSRAIAEAHGGRIEVASEPGRGSTFTLRLPLAPAVRSPPAPPPAGAPERP